MNNPLLLVTGAAGFIGAKFVESCNRKGVPVISVDALKNFDERKEHQGLDFGTRVERDRLFTWLRVNHPQVSAVVHLGACTDTTQMNEDYLKHWNLDYSKSLWKYCTESATPLVYASSAATYGDGSLGYGDDESLIPQLKPLNPYGESKRLFDLWALGQEGKGLAPPAWSGFKFFNVYGFGERHKAKMASVVLHAFDQIREKGSVELFKSHKPGIADGEQKRDFVFVEDVVSVLEFALEKPIQRGIYNLGSGRARSFLDLVRAVFHALGRPEKIHFIPTPEAIRGRYQYFTEARLERLREQGYSKPFAELEAGVRNYVGQLQKP
jgi:ADP-L-glycero-D-manno-heptose 6-epimerase